MGERRSARSGYAYRGTTRARAGLRGGRSSDAEQVPARIDERELAEAARSRAACRTRASPAGHGSAGPEPRTRRSLLVHLLSSAVDARHFPRPTGDAADGHGRNLEVERRSFAVPRLDPDAPAHTLDELAADVEPEPRAADAARHVRIEPIELLEHARLLVVGN